MAVSDGDSGEVIQSRGLNRAACKTAKQGTSMLGQLLQSKADSTLGASRATPHPSTDRAQCRLTSEVGRIRCIRHGMAASEMMRADGQEVCHARERSQDGATAMAGKMCASRLGMSTFVRELLKMTEDMKRAREAMTKMAKTCCNDTRLPAKRHCSA